MANKLENLVFILVFCSIRSFSVSQSSDDVCSIDIEVIISENKLKCDGGDWGGFLRSNCCGVVFNHYLIGLAKQANLTGKIFLNPIEQRNCLTSLKYFEGDILSCGIEKLTSGGGSCSDFSVKDVESRLGGELRSLGEDCRLSGSVEEVERWCGTCLRKWEELGKSFSNSKEFEKSKGDVCRFAVLVSLISIRIQETEWGQNINTCLGKQQFLSEDDTGKSKKQISQNLWLLIGGVIGILVVVAIAATILLKRPKQSKLPPAKDATNKEVEQPQEKTGCKKFPVKDIYYATNDLNAMNFIGQGIAGKVYKGVLANGRHIAVKHIMNDGHMETFVREVTSLSHVRHPNLVALVGYCEEEEECFLVYELCPNGNLSEWLFGKDKILSWIQRLEIAIDAARGLWFLHTFPEGYIVHRDIKPTNILLGKNFEAKLSDFGLSKVIDMEKSYVSSEVRGTFGYVDPEYQRNHRVNSFGDVYSFGIVLLQIISGKRVINLNMAKPMPLDKMAKFLTRGGNLSEFADPKLNGEFSTEAFDLILKLALSCTSHKQQRPSMEQVVKRLENAFEISIREKDMSLTPIDTP